MQPRCFVCDGLLVEQDRNLWECPTCRDVFGMSDEVRAHLVEPEPTIPLTQVEAMLREAMAVTADIIRDNPSLEGRCTARDKWIANKIKEARQ